MVFNQYDVKPRILKRALSISLVKLSKANCGQRSVNLTGKPGSEKLEPFIFTFYMFCSTTPVELSMQRRVLEPINESNDISSDTMDEEIIIFM